MYMYMYSTCVRVMYKQQNETGDVIVKNYFMRHYYWRNTL